MFPTPPRTNFAILATFKFLSENALNLDEFKILSVGKELTFSQTSPCFHLSAVKKVLETLGKGEISPNKQFPLFPQFLAPLAKGQ